MRRMLTAAVCVAILTLFLQAARPAPNQPNTGTQNGDAGHFVLKESSLLGNGSDHLLSSIYSTGTGQKHKEILSIWSAEKDAYDLKYISTTESGKKFRKPALLTMKNRQYIEIVTVDSYTGGTDVHAVLSLQQDGTLEEVETEHARKIVHIQKASTH